MSNVVKIATLLACLPTLSVTQNLGWSDPTLLRESSDYIASNFASSPNGSAIFLWTENTASSPSLGPNYFAKIFRPGFGWSPATLIWEGTDRQLSAAAIANDGRVLLAWRPVSSDPVRESASLGVSELIPGAGWGPMQVLSTEAVAPLLAIAPDGRAHIVYNQRTSENTFALVARTLALGTDVWSPPVVLGQANPLSTERIEVQRVALVLAIAPDGRAHIVYRQSMSENVFALVAQTLTPGTSVWSPPVVLGYANPSGSSMKLVALSDSAYVAFMSSESAVSVASYTADGWHPAVSVSDPDTRASDPELVANNHHVVLSWTTYNSGVDPSTRWVQRLTDSLERFRLPIIGRNFFPGYPGWGLGSACNIGLGPDGTVLAACAEKGKAVPNCQDISRSGPVPAFNYYVKMFRRPVDRAWSDPEIVSDLRKRVVLSPHVLANSSGDILVHWDSEVPCQSIGNRPATRLWRSSMSAWEPETELGIETSFPQPLHSSTQMLNLSVDTSGTFRALWSYLEYNPTAQPLRSVWTAELVTHSPEQ